MDLGNGVPQNTEQDTQHHQQQNYLHHPHHQYQQQQQQEVIEVQILPQLSESVCWTMHGGD